MSPTLVKSKRYPNLFRDSESQIFQFRKYSKLKRKQFFRSTGEKVNEARAYKIGIDAFNEWLGKVSDESGVVYFGRYAKRYLNEKLDNPTLAPGTKRTFQDQIEASTVSSGRKNEKYRPRLIDAFGHLPIEKVTNELWIKWVNLIREYFPDFKFFNARKALVEILIDALEKGHIKRVPEFDNPDGDAAPPRKLTDLEIRKLFNAAHYVEYVRGPNKTIVIRMRTGGKIPVRFKNWIKLLMLIMWKQGARPGEILQYEWSMIHFDEDEDGRIHIPGKITKTRRARVIVLNPSVSRVLKFLMGKAESPFIFPTPGNPERPIKSYHKTWAGVVRRAGFHAQMYWFRDTFFTRKLEEGLSSVFLGKYCDSSSTMIEKKYAVLSDKTQRDVAK